MTEFKHIGKNVRCIRLLRGIKQERFAEFLNLTQQKVSKLENRKNLPFDVLQNVARVLGVSVGAIQQFDENAALNAGLLEKQPPMERGFKEMIQYFHEELAKRDTIIEQLRAALGAH